MQWTRIAFAFAVVLGALALAQGGCEPRLSLQEAGTEATPIAATETPDLPVPAAAEDSAADVSSEPVATPVTTPAPAPGLPAGPAPSATTSAVPRPSQVAASASPSATVPTSIVAVSLAKDNRVAEVDPFTGKTIRVVDLSEAAGNMTLAPDGRSAWVFKPQGAGTTIALLDVNSGDRREDIQFHQGETPVAVAFSSDGSRAYVAIDGSVVFASSAGKEFGRVMPGRQTAGVQIPRRISSLAVSPGPNGDIVFAADHTSGVVWALDGGSGALLNTIDVGGGPLNIVTDPARQRAYVLLDTLNQLVTIDATNMQVIQRVDLPAAPLAQAVGPDGTVFVTSGDSNGEVWVIRPDAAAVRARVPLGGKLVGIALSADGSSLFVPDASANVLNIISADTVQVLRTVALASEPVSVVVTHPSLAAKPTAGANAPPDAPPALVPGPTALPEGALPPDKLPTGALAEPFVSGAEMPSALAFAGDGRLFYAEQQTGKIRVVQNGVLLSDPFYQFLVAGDANGGLLGLTLDPDFAHNHYLYALYTAPKTAAAGAGGTGPNEVVRLTDVDSKGTDLRAVLQDLPASGTQSAGGIAFGPDGKLYVAVADDDKGTNAQDLGSLAGKILRVNTDGSAPEDNPFVGQSGKQDAIWAYGFHNPYSVAFHPLGHGLLAVDSAAGDHDALALVVRGGNYGFPASAAHPITGAVDPMAVIKPSIQPTGSTFYLGAQLPEWNNDWFYCDASLKQLRRVHLASQSFDRIVFEEVVKQGCSEDVATGPDGALYYSDAHGIYRIRMPGAEVLQAPGLGS